MQYNSIDCILHERELFLYMGDSRICSRGFPEGFVVHGALASRKFFRYYHAHFHINYCAYHDIIVKDSPKVVL